jgi:signal transduction histidine kinase
MPRPCAGGSHADLATIIAHEVNQPLAAIVTNAECCLFSLQKGHLDLDSARQAAERIVRDGHYASAVIRSARAMLRDRKPQMAPVDIRDLIGATTDMLHGELHRHQIQLDLRLCKDFECVLGDRGQLQQVMVNLFRNAIESMTEEAAERRVLLVGTSVDADGRAVIAIADSGRGVDAPRLNQVFAPFFTTKRDGLGIGLSICHSIIEAHGGRIWVSRGAPCGSIFQFTVPRAHPAA